MTDVRLVPDTPPATDGQRAYTVLKEAKAGDLDPTQRVWIELDQPVTAASPDEAMETVATSEWHAREYAEGTKYAATSRLKVWVPVLDTTPRWS